MREISHHNIASDSEEVVRQPNHLTALIRFLTASKSKPRCSHTHRQEPTPSRREVNHRNAPCRCCSLCKSTIAVSRTASQRFRSAISGFPLSCGFPGSAAFQYFAPRSRCTRSKFLGGILFPDRTPSSTAISLPFAEISKFAASTSRIFPFRPLLTPCLAIFITDVYRREHIR